RTDVRSLGRDGICHSDRGGVRAGSDAIDRSSTGCPVDSHVPVRLAFAHREGGSMSRTAEAVRSGRSERVPPHHLEAEESVLGAMMFSPEAIASVVEHVKPGDFYRPAHQRLFEVMLVLYGRGEPVDAISVVEELSRRDLLEDIGGRLYVHNLLESVPLPAAAGHHARIVDDHALLRRLIEASAQIMADAYAIPEDPRRAADRAESLIYQ